MSEFIEQDCNPVQDLELRVYQSKKKDDKVQRIITDARAKAVTSVVKTPENLLREEELFELDRELDFIAQQQDNKAKRRLKKVKDFIDDVAEEDDRSEAEIEEDYSSDEEEEIPLARNSRKADREEEVTLRLFVDDVSLDSIHDSDFDGDSVDLEPFGDEEPKMNEWEMVKQIAQVGDLVTAAKALSSVEFPVNDTPLSWTDLRCYENPESLAALAQKYEFPAENEGGAITTTQYLDILVKPADKTKSFGPITELAVDEYGMPEVDFGVPGEDD